MRCWNNVIRWNNSYLFFLFCFCFFALFVYLFNCLLTVPSAPPSAVKGHNTSSTSILVQWGNVSAADQNGVILHYTVTYRALPDGSQQTKVVSAPTTQTTLTGLNEYTNYSVTVFASTVKGGGNVSEPIIVITDQDSEFTAGLSLICNYIYGKFPWFLLSFLFFKRHLVVINSRSLSSLSSLVVFQFFFLLILHRYFHNFYFVLPLFH